MKKRFCKISLYINYVLFFLIIGFSFVGPTKLFSIGGNYFPISFYLSFLALPFFYICYFFVYRNNFLSITIKNIIVLFSILFVSSLAMGYLLYPNYYGFFETTPTKTVIVNAVKYAYDLLFIPYFIFFLSILKGKTLRIAIIIFLNVWIAFGAFQILAFYVNKDTLWSVYDKIDFLKVIGGKSDVFARIRLNYGGSFRFFGLATEPATNSILISVILIPFLITEIKKWPKSIIYRTFLIISLVITLIFAYLTKSASVYLGLFIIALYLFYKLLNSNSLKKIWKIIAISAVLLIIILIFVIPASRNAILNRFLFKIIDTSDYSTQHRYSTIWNDLLVFITHPLFGVGDGNQGYFYAKNVIGTWMSNNAETQAAIRGEAGLLNGGSAIPSIISGFGIFGIAILIYYFRKYYMHWAKRNTNFQKFKSFFILSGIIFLIMSIASQGIHRNYLLILYISSVALFTSNSNNTKDMIVFLEHDDDFKVNKEIGIENYYEVTV